MTTVLPVRLHFRIPRGWTSADPDEVGEPWSAFVAGHPPSIENGFAAKITIAGSLRPDNASVGDIAAATVRDVAKFTDGVQLVARREIGGRSPTVVQVVRLTLFEDGTKWPLVQSQVFLEVRDRDYPRKRVIAKIALTALPTQLQTVAGDFAAFVRSIRPAEPGAQPSDL